MIYKIAIWGTGNYSGLLQEALLTERTQVVSYIESAPRVNTYNGVKLLSPNEIKTIDIDILFVANNFEDEITPLLQEIGFDMERVVYIGRKAFLKINVGSEKAIARALYCLDKKSDIYRAFFNVLTYSNKPFIELPSDMRFFANGVDYIYMCMLVDDVVYSKYELDRFIALANKYYEINEKGYFLDCGCNIGTSFCYFLNHYKNLRSIGFEPIKENSHVAELNAIINGFEDRASVVNKGLSQVNGKTRMFFDKYNSGGSKIVKEDFGDDKETETYVVDVVSVDSYLKKVLIDYNDISYIWIDVEGFEGNVMEGMKTLLKGKRIPAFIEFNKELLMEQGDYEKLITILETFYKGFIKVKNGVEEKEYPIECIKNVEEPINLFLI